jgi:hypothetical protein
MLKKFYKVSSLFNKRASQKSEEEEMKTTKNSDDTLVSPSTSASATGMA